jgi:formylglycine-generating enzyme required for sulfatase activity
MVDFMHRIRTLPASLGRGSAIGIFSLRVLAMTMTMALASAGDPCAAQIPSQAVKPPGDGKNLATEPTTNTLGVRFVEVPGTPVLFAQWETRVSDFATFVREAGYTWDFTANFPQSSDHPVVNVTMRDAMAYCNWLTKREQDAGAISNLQSYRLPTRKEWDAAVGLAAGRRDNAPSLELEKDKQRFPWGMEWPPPLQAGNLNFLEISGKDDGYTYTAPVGRFAPSAEGIYDLAGNVWEWTWDRDTQSESVGILRGGSWMYFRKECLLSSYQYEVPSTLRSSSVGFRCVFDDKRRVATFLAKAKERGDANKATASTGARREPMVTAEEVKKMRDEMNEKSKSGPQTVAGPKIPDPTTLTAARPGQPYTNLLGMKFLPVKGTPRVLVGVHEVRVQDYEAAMKSLGRSWNRKPAFTYTETHPMMNVTWQEAVKFCEWLTERDQKAGLIGPRARYRLPTDLEWSLAAGLTGEKGDTPQSRNLENREEYPWGKTEAPPPQSANLDSAKMTSGYQDSYSHTAPVGSFPPNALGFHDLAGNVAEWCEDAWPPVPGDRVIRGSSWLTSSADAMLSSARQHLGESSARPDTGFRVVLEFGS